ncbi:DNA/RNA helicase domain-containing protein [Amedibacillus sp. YH-ame6]
MIAINALAKLTSEGLMCQYITKNAAPRNVYHSKMKKKSQENVRSLFTNADDFYKLTESNCIDVALVDESHRLRKLSGVFNNLGENQIKEIINSSLLSVFFIDSFQRVTYRDFGTIDEITKQANSYHALITEVDLFSQFRCNGSDGYISWIRHMLGMEQSANFNFSDIDFDFRVFDSPSELHDMIRQRNDENKRSRLIAGYCWDWPKTGRTNPNILDIKIDDFEMSWNLDNANPFAIDENSIHQVGCIHTVQGLEFDYVGIIIGNDLRYDNGIVTDYKARAKTDKSFFGMKKGLNYDKGRIEEVTREIILNTYYTLMSRGMKGCYVYCCDKGLQNYIKSLIKQ